MFCSGSRALTSLYSHLKRNPPEACSVVIPILCEKSATEGTAQTKRCLFLLDVIVERCPRDCATCIGCVLDNSTAENKLIRYGAVVLLKNAAKKALETLQKKDVSVTFWTAGFLSSLLNPLWNIVDNECVKTGTDKEKSVAPKRIAACAFDALST